jgi:phage baseplate assembly protein gpV
MCKPMAGSNYGFYFMPEVGDEVLVAFIQGDMRLPVILGGLYNGVDKPPAQHPKLRRIQSVNGHRITFVDALPREDTGKIFKRKLRDQYRAATQPASTNGV